MSASGFKGVTCTSCIGLHVARPKTYSATVQVMSFFGALLYADVKLVVAWVVYCPPFLRAALELYQVSAVLLLHTWMK